MNYIEFKQIQELLPEKFGRYFKASKFMKFTKDDDNRISMLHFYNYILRKGKCYVKLVFFNRPLILLSLSCAGEG